MLLNVKTNLYLHITERWIMPEMPFKFEPEAWRPLDPDRREQPGAYVKRFEVNVSTSMSRFQVLPHTQQHKDEKKYIKGGQVVRLQHTELSGYLTSDDTDFTADGLAEVYVRCFKSAPDGTEAEAKQTGDLFEIEIADANDRGRVCMWSEKASGAQDKFKLNEPN